MKKEDVIQDFLKVESQLESNAPLAVQNAAKLQQKYFCWYRRCGRNK